MRATNVLAAALGGLRHLLGGQGSASAVSGGLSDKDVEDISKEAAKKIFDLVINERSVPCEEAADLTSEVAAHMSKEFKQGKIQGADHEARFRLWRAAAWRAMDWRIHNLYIDHEARAREESRYLYHDYKIMGKTRLESLEMVLDEKRLKEWKIEWKEPSSHGNDLEHIRQSIIDSCKSRRNSVDQSDHVKNWNKKPVPMVVFERKTALSTFYPTRKFYIAPHDFLEFYLPYFFLTTLKSLTVGSDDADVENAAKLEYMCMYFTEYKSGTDTKVYALKKEALEAAYGKYYGKKMTAGFKDKVNSMSARFDIFLRSVDAPTTPTTQDEMERCRQKAVCACLVFFFHLKELLKEEMKKENRAAKELVWQYREFRWRSKTHYSTYVPANVAAHRGRSANATSARESKQDKQDLAKRSTGNKIFKIMSGRVKSMKKDVEALGCCIEKVWKSVSGDLDDAKICPSCSGMMLKYYLQQLVKVGPRINKSARECYEYEGQKKGRRA